MNDKTRDFLDHYTSEIKTMSMNSPPRRPWKELPTEIQNSWIQEMHAFYPAGAITISEAIELAQSEYELSDSESLYPSAASEA